MNLTRNLAQELVKNGRVGVIKDEDPVFRNCLAEIKEALGKRGLLPFLGAGISTSEPSRLPLAEPLTEPIREAMWEASREVRIALIARGKNEAIQDSFRLLFKETRMENLFDALHDAFGTESLEFLRVLDGMEPNRNHKALASLAVAGYLPYCITLNFDVLLETTVKIKKGRFTTYCPLSDQTLGEEIDSSSEVLIIKPHGSFAKPGQGQNRLRFVAATLKQSGRLPMQANMDAIGKLIGKSQLLLVAGYSDNDWDIFPILKEFSKEKNLRVIWIEHAGFEQCKDLPSPQQIVNLLERKGSREKVLGFIHSLGPRGTILVGDCIDIFEDLPRQMGSIVEDKLSLGDVWGERYRRKEDEMFQSQAAIGKLKTEKSRLAFAFAGILGARDEKVLSRSLLEWIRSQAGSTDLELKGECLWRLGGSLYMENKSAQAISRGHEALKVLQSTPTISPLVMADHYAWMGYMYLGLARPPKILGVLNFLKFPYHFLRGILFLTHSIRIEQRRSKDTIVQGRAKYYALDYLHHWVNVTLLLGQRGRFLSRPIHSAIGKLYGRLFEKYPQQKEVELYRMREWEARVIGGAGKSLRQEFMHGLNIIEESCKLTLNEHHLGNVYVYKALLHFEDGNFQEAENLLAKAESHWASEAFSSGSGKRRIWLFRRFLNLKNTAT
jgi:SIR2-like domain